MPGDVATLIVAYQAERYLGEALESVFAQTVRTTQVVVVDDGSTDATSEIAAADSRVELVRVEHGGASIARNAGLERCDRELVALLDADDVWLSVKLERQLAALRSDVDAVFCQADEFVESGVDVAEAGMRAPRLAVDAVIPSAALLRRDLVERIGPFSTGTSRWATGSNGGRVPAPQGFGRSPCPRCSCAVGCTVPTTPPSAPLTHRPTCCGRSERTSSPRGARNERRVTSAGPRVSVITPVFDPRRSSRMLFAASWRRLPGISNTSWSTTVPPTARSASSMTSLGTTTGFGSSPPSTVARRRHGTAHWRSLVGHSSRSSTATT